MKYLAEALLVVSTAMPNYLGHKGGLIKWLVKIFLVGIVFIFITWLLFGEAIHPKSLLLLPFYILTGQV